MSHSNIVGPFCLSSGSHTFKSTRDRNKDLLILLLDIDAFKTRQSVTRDWLVGRLSRAASKSDERGAMRRMSDKTSCL